MNSISYLQGIKKGDGTSSKDFKTTKSRDQIIDAFKDFTNGFPNAAVSKTIFSLSFCIEFELRKEKIALNNSMINDAMTEPNYTNSCFE